MTVNRLPFIVSSIVLTGNYLQKYRRTYQEGAYAPSNINMAQSKFPFRPAARNHRNHSQKNLLLLTNT